MTCNVHSPPLVHVRVVMGGIGGLIPIFIGELSINNQLPHGLPQILIKQTMKQKKRTHGIMHYTSHIQHCLTQCLRLLFVIS